MTALFLAVPVAYIKSKSPWTACSVWFLVDMNFSVPAALWTDVNSFLFRTAGFVNWRKKTSKSSLSHTVGDIFSPISSLKPLSRNRYCRYSLPRHLLQLWSERCHCQPTSSIFWKMRFIFHEATQEVTL